MDTTLPTGNKWNNRLWQQALQPMLLADASGKVAAANRSFEQLMGWASAKDRQYTVLPFMGWGLPDWQQLCVEVQKKCSS